MSRGASRLRVAAVLLALGLCACSRPQRQAHIDAAPESPAAAGAVTSDPKVTTYLCADGETVQAGYPDRDTAVVEYRGHAYPLKIARSASGARYIGYGLQWWTKGMDEAALAPLKDGEEIASAPGVACSTRPPPPTGTEAPPPPAAEPAVAPTSAAGAAAVVRTYYALLAAGNYGQARDLWSDGGKASNRTPAEFARDQARYSQLDAQVGAPGVIEGAAGSLYVEVPVTVIGRLAGGEVVRRSGKVVLRRVNDVPGSTAAQRTWHIAQLDLQG